MKSKKLLLTIIIAIFVLILAIPNFVQAGENDPIVFTGEKFQEALITSYGESISKIDTNHDGKFTQKELNNETEQLWLNTYGFTAADFENLKYFKEAQSMYLTDADFTGEIDLTGLTKLESFTVETYNKSKLPHFKFHNNIWQYIFPRSESVYNESTHDYEVRYCPEDLENYHLKTLWLGGPNTIYVGDDVLLFSHYGEMMANMQIDSSSTITVQNPSVLQVFISNENWGAYTAFGLTAGTSKITFQNIFNETREKTIQVKASSINSNPAKDTNNTSIRLFSDDKVLVSNGDLYDYNFQKQKFVRIDKNVKDYAIGSYNVSGKLKGTTLTITYENERLEEGIWLYTTRTKTVENVKSIQGGDSLRVITTNNELIDYYIDYSNYNATEYDLTSINYGEGVTLAQGSFYIANGYLSYANVNNNINYHSNIACSTINDVYDAGNYSYALVGHNLYCLLDATIYQAGNWVNYTDIILVSDNVQNFLKTKGGCVYGITYVGGAVANTIDFYYTPEGTSSQQHVTSYMFGMNSFPTSTHDATSNYYELNVQDTLVYGLRDSVQLTDVVTAAHVLAEDSDAWEDSKGLLAQRDDNTIWLQVKPFETWKKVFVLNPTQPFPDVPNGTWYTDGAKYCKDHGIMGGYTEGLNAGDFGTDDLLLRGQILVMFYRLAGEPSVAGLSNPFTDVPEGKYYTNAIKWAVSKGITTGYTATTFGPNNYVTRQELAVFMARYAKNVLNKNINSTYDITGIADYSNLSSWARAPMQYIMEKGIITGDMALGYPRILPKANATRATAATMFMRFCKNVVGMS